MKLAMQSAVRLLFFIANIHAYSPLVIFFINTMYTLYVRVSWTFKLLWSSVRNWWQTIFNGLICCIESFQIPWYITVWVSKIYIIRLYILSLHSYYYHHITKSLVTQSRMDRVINYFGHFFTYLYSIEEKPQSIFKRFLKWHLFQKNKISRQMRVQV